MVIFAAMPILVSASVEISEIMYDFPGTEGSGEHDWIEVENKNTESVDLSKFRFFEANTNHGLKLDRGSSIIPPGSFAVIANATSTFLNDFPGFSGTLFDSSFSLNSTSAGERLVIRNADLIDENEVTYSSDWGAKDDGNSLQKINGQWKVGAPTPGIANVTNSSSSNNPPANEQSTSSPNQSSGASQSSSTGSSYEKSPEMFVSAGANRTAVVGADALFLGKALGTDGKPLENVRFLWNFGDGETKEGQNVLHRFRFPSEYIVTLDIAYGKWSGTARLTIIAIKSPLVISQIKEGVDGFVEVANEGGAELDLFGWYLKSSNISFLLPKNTIIAGNKKIIFPNEVTKLDGNDVLLLYPNGVVAASFKETPTAPAPASAPPMPKPVSSIKSDSVSPKSDLEKLQDIPTTIPVTAAVYEATPESSGFGIWLLALGGLIVVSLSAFLFSKQKPIPADEYKIIE